MDPLVDGLGGKGGFGDGASNGLGGSAGSTLGRVAAMFQQATEAQLQANEVTTKLQTMKDIARKAPQ